ncbi:MAG: hypothetical protein KC944_05165 [Candidatus Omnitrophica bacterium]|nr:hypothetical protein [Candidatus Omnitrophota bacterium]
MRTKRIPLLWWLAWCGIQLWIIHPAIHSGISHCATSTSDACGHPTCSHSHNGHEDPGDSESHSHGPCELCAANGEKEPFDFATRVRELLASLPFSTNLNLDAEKEMVQPLLLGPQSLRGPPSFA